MAARSGHTALRVAGAAAGIAAGAAVAACALVAPRRPDAERAARWAELARYRYAHRGLHAEGAPENSLAAFRHARELGFGVELDVHLTLDGHLAVIHDSDLTRVTGRAGVVEQKSLLELGEYRLLGTSEGIPTLPEVLPLFERRTSADAPAWPEPAPLIVELKPDDTNHALLCERVMACLDAHDVRYCVESFDPRVLRWLREHRPEVLRGQLAEDFVRRGPQEQPLPLRVAGTFLLGNATGRPDFVAYRFQDRHNPAVRLACEVMGAPLATWTIRSEKDLLASEAEGAVGIFEGFVPSSRSTIRA